MSLVSRKSFSRYRLEQLLQSSHTVLHKHVELLLLVINDHIKESDDVLVPKASHQLYLTLYVLLSVRYLFKPFLLHDLRRTPFQSFRVQHFFYLREY